MFYNIIMKNNSIVDIYIIKHIPNTLKPLCFLNDATEVLWWINKDSDLAIDTIHTIQTETAMLLPNKINIFSIEFNDLPKEIQGFLVLYKYDIDELKRNLGKEKWLKFLALHFK